VPTTFLPKSWYFMSRFLRCFSINRPITEKHVILCLQLHFLTAVNANSMRL